MTEVRNVYNTDQVNVGWYGYETTKTARIRVGPGHHFPKLAEVKTGYRVGRQSVRNPKGLDNPPFRPVERDQWQKPWVWVYDPETKVSGWVPLSILKSNDKVEWAHGPEGKDFHVGFGHTRKRPKSTLHGSRRNRVKVIHAEKVAVRYAPNSTSFYYLQRGNGVRELYRRLQNDYVAVSVTSSKTCPVATRGWVDVRALAGEKTTGIDISASDGHVDYEAVRGSGEEFVIIKATEGTKTIDSGFFQNVEAARKAYLHVGAYHVLRPLRGRSGTLEADDFIRALKLAKIRSTDIRPSIKIEQSKLDRDGTEKYVGEFVGALRLAGYDALLYTYPKFLNWTKAFNTDLWISNYNVTKPSIPEPWDDYALWQYARGKVPGIMGQVDRSKCPDLARVIQR